MAKKRKSKSRNMREVASTLPESGRKAIPSDIGGSYTGTASDGSAPEQDADDL